MAMEALAEDGTAICAACVLTLPPTSAHYYTNSVGMLPGYPLSLKSRFVTDSMDILC